MKMPESLFTSLQTLGWEGSWQEVEKAYATDPSRVEAWLTYILAKKGALSSPAGLFRTRLRDGTYPPNYQASPGPVDQAAILEAQREQARQKIAEARRRRNVPGLPGKGANP